MPRYIDADNILYKDLSEGRGVCWVTFRDWIKEMPTADVVEVVRCKDCKHYKRNIPCVGGHYNGCDEWIDEGNPITVYDNDFCSYGERAEQ